MLVCHCMQVSDRHIRKYKSLTEVRDKTRATLGCGNCLQLVIRILNGYEISRIRSSTPKVEGGDDTASNRNLPSTTSDDGDH